MIRFEDFIKNEITAGASALGRRIGGQLNLGGEEGEGTISPDSAPGFARGLRTRRDTLEDLASQEIESSIPNASEEEKSQALTRMLTDSLFGMYFLGKTSGNFSYAALDNKLKQRYVPRWLRGKLQSQLGEDVVFPGDDKDYEQEVAQQASQGSLGSRERQIIGATGLAANTVGKVSGKFNQILKTKVLQSLNQMIPVIAKELRGPYEGGKIDGFELAKRGFDRLYQSMIAYRASDQVAGNVPISKVLAAQPRQQPKLAL